MNIRSLAKRSLIVLILFLLSIFLSFPAQIALAQGPGPFLITPYFGTYNGDRRGPPNGKSDCAPNGLDGKCYDGHEGVDFSLSYEPVIAAASGTVTLVGWTSLSDRNFSYGLQVRINHPNGYFTLYGHLSAIKVVLGQTVQAGQVIGTSGKTGSISGATGQHLHFGVLDSGNNPIDPFGSAGVSNSCLWADGEWANYCGGVSRQVPAPLTSGEIIIDDNTSNANGFSKGTGNQVFINPCLDPCSDWSGSGTGGYNNGHRYWTTVTGNTTAANWAAWVANIGSNNQGSYEVQVYIPGSNNTTWQANYQVRHNGGQASVLVDQAGSGGQWISLGIYQFTLFDGYTFATDATAFQGGSSNPCGTGNGCQVAVDAVRFRRLATYLPDIRSSTSDGWDSAFYIRNDGAGPTDVVINALDQNGNSVERFTYTNLQVHARLYYNPTVTNWSGAVAVDSAQPVSVAVTQQNLSPFRSAAYTGVDKLATEAHIPLLHKNNGAWTSDIFIQNTRNAAANVTVEFKVAAIFGQGTDCTQNYTIAAYGMRKIDLGSLSCVGSSFLGGARITSTQPVVVATTERTGSLLMETSNAVGPATGTGYLPLVQNEGGSGWTSGLSLQNVSNNTQTLNASYYVRSGAACGSANYPNVGAYRPYIVNPFPPSCPDIIEGATLTGPDRVTAMLNQLRPTNSYASTYTAIATPGKTIYLPFWLKQSGWVPGLAVYNPNNQSASVTVRYYNADGSLNSSPPSQATIAAHGVAIFYNTPSAASFSGSAVVTSNQPVAAVLNHSSSSSGGDGLMTYEGLHY